MNVLLCTENGLPMVRLREMPPTAFPTASTNNPNEVFDLSIYTSPFDGSTIGNNNDIDPDFNCVDLHGFVAPEQGFSYVLGAGSSFTTLVTPLEDFDAIVSLRWGGEYPGTELLGKCAVSYWNSCCLQFIRQSMHMLKHYFVLRNARLYPCLFKSRA